MNCTNCGGLTAPDVTGTVLRCRFCESVRSLVAGDGPDGLVLLGPESEFACPVGCGPLSGAILDGRPAAGCPECLGVLMRSEEFGPLVAERRRNWDGADARPRPVDPASLHRAADCPGCGYRMETHPYYGPGNAVVDSCRRCGVLWLDAGEIAAIERSPGRR